MYQHRAHEIPREVSIRGGREYGYLGRYIEEKLDEYSLQGWEFLGTHTVSIQPPYGGCLFFVFGGSAPRDAQVMVFRKQITLEGEASAR